MKAYGCAFLVFLFLAGCSASGPARRPDPLIGRLFDAQGKEIQQQTFYRRLAQYDVLYLGESHDNATHHQLQLEVIQQLLQQGRKPDIAMEFFAQWQTPVLMAFVQAPKAKKPSDETARLQRLRGQLNWKQVSDKLWKQYSAFIVLARQQGLRVYGADISRALAYRLTQQGYASLTPLEQQQSPQGDFVDPAYEALMRQRFIDGHCGWSEPTVLKGLYEAWLARNQAMAEAIVRMQRKNEPTVVILGNGHVENNYAVYERVKKLNPTLKQLNLGFQEVTIKPSLLAAYLTPDQALGRTFPSRHQVYWFTPRSDWEDPCEKYKKSLKAHSTHKTKP